MKESEYKPPVFNTRSVRLKGHFESYDEKPTYENGEPEFDEVRDMIAEHFGVPNDEQHRFIIDNKLVARQRHQRAFCVLRRQKEDGSWESWYIDGRVAHVTMLERLYNYYKIPDDDMNEKHLGFLDNEAFEHIPEIQKKAEEQGSPIYWFIRETVSPSPEKSEEKKSEE